MPADTKTAPEMMDATMSRSEAIKDAVYFDLMARTGRLVFGHEYQPNWPERVVQLTTFAEPVICNGGLRRLYRTGGFARLVREIARAFEAVDRPEVAAILRESRKLLPAGEFTEDQQRHLVMFEQHWDDESPLLAQLE